jgi:hypothetical protein
MIRDERDWLQRENARLDAEPREIRAGEWHVPINEARRCQARVGGEHSYWRSKQDGKRRCWFCCQLKPEDA